MDIPQLRTIIHVAELGSLSKAADRLRIAQPALSRQVRLLEEELGVRLFDRHGRGMVVTEAGQEVLRHAQSIMGALDNIRASVSDENAPLSGHVSVGMPPTVSDILSLPLIAAFKERHPAATIRIVSAYSGFLLDWLQRGTVDVAVLIEDKPTRTLRCYPLLEEDLCLIGPPESGLSAKRPVPFSALEQWPFLLPSPGHGLRMIVEKCAAEAAISLNVKVEADSYATLKNLVRSGYGMTILPLAPIHDEITRGALTFAGLTGPMPVRKLLLSYPSDRPVTRLTKFAGQVLSKTAAGMVASGSWAGRLPEEFSL